VLNWSSWGTGKSGENPGLCRNCDGANASSQNTGSSSVPIWYLKSTISLRRIGKELDVLSAIERSICPDIYHPAVARDGLLTRLRIPGGVLNTAQCAAIAQLLAAIGLEYLQVTNRANLQLRALSRDLAPELLTELATCGLAASNNAIEGIRSMMMSPTAGIDARELVDVRPLATAWHEYLDRHPELGILSTKFSVGFDGGGSVGISDRPNDITLLAVSEREFSLHLSMGDRGDAPSPVGVKLTLAECVPMLAAIAQSYRVGILAFGGDSRRKPRLRSVIHHYGLAEFSAIVRRELAGSRHFVFKTSDLEPPISANADCHLGVHPQRQADLYYLGVVLPLGRWTIAQIQGLGSIADRYGSGNIRLTPWQNLIIPDLQAVDLQTVQDLITKLGLVQTANHPSSLLRACAGITGCQFSATDTQTDAIALANYLATNFSLDRPLSIHFSGCDKSCAQHDRADITLWGDNTNPELPNSYRLEIDGLTAAFTQESIDLLPPERVPIAIGNLIATYHQHRLNPQESFRSFNRRIRL
jgi:ferredoxin-nitrite reductase